MSTERTLVTQVHGRYVFDAAPGHATRPLLAGFHGYGELAADQFDRLAAIRASLLWDIVSIQGLHRFYRREGQHTAASWMTRDDRELMILDNVQYVNHVLTALANELGEPPRIAFAGFSQGASMAYRAACLCERPASGVVVCGGDIPPELTDQHLSRIPAVLIGWGVHDRFYSEPKLDADVLRLRRSGVAVTVDRLDTSHQWTDVFSNSASIWLRDLTHRSSCLG